MGTKKGVEPSRLEKFVRGYEKAMKVRGKSQFVATIGALIVYGGTALFCAILPTLIYL